jgi:hypothetical protein
MYTANLPHGPTLPAGAAPVVVAEAAVWSAGVLTAAPPLQVGLALCPHNTRAVVAVTIL